MSYVDPSGLTQEDANTALNWIRNHMSNFFNSSNPGLTNTPVMGLNLGSDTRGLALPFAVLVNYNLLDSLNPPGRERTADYIKTISHEFLHVKDYRNLNFSNFNEKGHLQIDNTANEISELYLNRQDRQCRRK